MLHEVVLRPLLEGLQRYAFVIEPAEHDDRDIGVRRPDRAQSFEPFRVRQRQVEQDAVHPRLAEVRLGIAYELVVR